MTPVSYTVFPNVGARKAAKRKQSWPELVERFKDPKEYRDKKAMPLLSMCRYGDKRSPKGSLRHSGNVLSVHGIEIDYDGEKVSPRKAQKRLEKAKLKSVIYTTPSHTADKPRWRALLPLSKPVSVDQRRELVARANRALGGIVARESFTPSQSFFFGKVRGRQYECHETRGKSVDRVDLEPLYPGGKGNGAAGAPVFDDIPDDVFIEAFEKGTGRHDAVLALTSRWIGKGRSPEKVRKELHKHIRLAEHDDVDPETTQGENLYKLVNRLTESADVKFGKDAKEKRPPKDKPKVVEAEFKDVADLNIEKPPPQEFVIPDWLPLPTVGLYVSHGGRGKSFISLTIGIQIAAGVSVFGREVEQGTVLYVSAEDEEAELCRRISRILKAQDIARDKIAGRLFLRDATVDNTVLFPASPADRGAAPTITKRFKWLRRQIKKYKPRLVILDSAVDHYAGNENDRVMVSTFLRKLLILAKRRKCSILLLAHVDAGTLKQNESGKGFSGSTAWHNRPRTLWYQSFKDESDLDPNAPQVITVKKINRAQPGAKVQVEWNTNSLVWDIGKTYRPHVGRYEYRVFTAVRQLIDSGKRVPAATSGKHTAVAIIRKHADCPKDLKSETKETKRLINEVLAELVKKQALKMVELTKAKGTKTTKFYVLGDKADDFDRKEDDA